MPRSPFERFTSTYVTRPQDNIDTDQIIPARFLTTTERDGLGKFLFHDWRVETSASAGAGAGAGVLVAGRNFGCGSSREHAVWALMDAGFRAVVSTSFADIFRGNALGNGLLPIEVPERVIDTLVRNLASASGATNPHVTVDLASQTFTLPDHSVTSFPIPPFAKHCLLRGIDEIDFLLDAADDICAYERAHEAPVFISRSPS
jgi:3-isopropylmalate/(R)-2-methylmalate dehydratase small subunit